MRLTIILSFSILLCFISPSLKAQQLDDAEDASLCIPEKMPEFPGGDVAFIKFVRENINYPTCNADSVSGKVIIRFTVDEEGCVTDIKVVRGLSPAFDKEALRVVSMLPDFIPGQEAGKPAKFKMVIPVFVCFR